MTTGWRRLAWLVRGGRPLALIGGALLYGVGVAIARYQGHPPSLRLYLLGQGLVSVLQLMTHFMVEYEHVGPAPDPERLPRRTFLNAAIVALGLAAVLTSLLALERAASISTWVVLPLLFLGGYFYSAAPLRLARSGYGEVALALLGGGLIPAFAESLQAGGVSGLLILSTAPLAALVFAMLMAFEMSSYEADISLGRRTLMVRIGWRTGMRLHDAAIACAVAAMALAAWNGLPPRVAVGALIALPLAAAQIWQVYRLRAGYRPQWRSLVIGAATLFALTAYLELAGFVLAG